MLFDVGHDPWFLQWGLGWAPWNSRDIHCVWEPVKRLVLEHCQNLYGRKKSYQTAHGSLCIFWGCFTEKNHIDSSSVVGYDWLSERMSPDKIRKRTRMIWARIIPLMDGRVIQQELPQEFYLLSCRWWRYSHPSDLMELTAFPRPVGEGARFLFWEAINHTWSLAVRGDVMLSCPGALVGGNWATASKQL